MSDSIKFGPEWLRNMSNDTSNLSSSASATLAAAGGGGTGVNLSTYTNSHTRYPLAEYRYGREEMLSLYDKNFKIPELLPKFTKLFIEKMQCPLALLPPTADEETPPRGIVPIGGLASERSGLGLSASSTSGSVLGGISSSLGISGRGARGSSIDRGRGRARGGLYHSSLGSYQRSTFGYDEESRGIGARGERSWSERNGTATETDWNTSSSSNPSPRKDFSTLRSGNSGESWRRSRGEEEGAPASQNGAMGEGWRTSSSSATSNSMYKWPVRSTSWRGGENEPNAAFSGDAVSSAPRLERSKSVQSSTTMPNRERDGQEPPHRRFGLNPNASWDEDNLPEWAMDEPIETGGSFDASGAFLGADDKYIGRRMRNNDSSQSNSETLAEKDDQKSNLNSSNEKDLSSQVDSSGDNLLGEMDESAKDNSNEDLSPENSERDESNQSDLKEQSSTEAEDLPSQQEHTLEHQPSKNFIDSVEKLVNSIEKASPSTPTATDRMQEVAEDIEKLIMDDDQSCNENDEADFADHWYYLDPQGKKQGPFNATEMLDWYRAGYFDENLHVKRVRDPKFLALGDLLKLCSGTIPFVSSPSIIPPLIPNSNSDINLNAAPTVQPTTPTKPLLVHNAKLPTQPSANNPSLNAALGPALLDDAVPHMHPSVQKQFFLNQQALAIKQLSENEPHGWNMVGPEQQAALIAQRMAQNQSPNDILQSQAIPVPQNPLLNHLMSSAASKTLPKHPNPHHLPNALTKQAHLKNQQQTQSLQHILSQHKKDFTADSANGNNVPVNMIHPVDMIHPLQYGYPNVSKDERGGPGNAPNTFANVNNSIGMNHQQISPPVNVMPVPGIPPPQQPPPNMVDNNPLKTLLIQLSMQKPLGGAPNNILQHNHHPQPPTHSQIHSHLPENRMSMPNTHAGLWDLPMPPAMQANQNANMPINISDLQCAPNAQKMNSAPHGMHNNLVPSSSMKTEMQIIEQHLKSTFSMPPPPTAEAAASNNIVLKKWISDSSELINNGSELSKWIPEQMSKLENAKEEQLKIEHLAAQQDQWKKQQQQQQQQQQRQQHHQQQQQQMQQQQPSNSKQVAQQLHMQQHHQKQQIQVQPLPNDLIQQADIFKAKNENIKDEQIELNRAAAKAAKTKAENKLAEQKLSQAINKSIENQIEEAHAAESKAMKAKAAAVAAAKQANEKLNQKAPSGLDANAKSANNVTAAAAKTPAKESTKKKGKEKDQKSAQAIEEKRRQEEEERQALEEKRRLELIAAQRKAKLVDQNAVKSESANKRNNLAASVAPWSNLTETVGQNASTSPLTLAEIQKAERERRSEMYRLEQAQQQTQAILEQQNKQDNVLKWKLKPQNQTKSLAEIQAEEAKQRQTIQLSMANAQQKQQVAKKDDKWPVSQWIWGEQAGSSGQTVNAALASGNGNIFWEDPVKQSTVTKVSVQQNGTGKALAKSQTVSNMQGVSAANSVKAAQNAAKATAISKTSSSGNVTATNSNATANMNASNNNNNNNNATAKKAKNLTNAKKGGSNAEDSGNDEFGAWCAKALAAHVDVIDVPTFVSFLRDIESPFEVKDYIRMYLGETKECGEFAKHFLERRSKYKNQQRAQNAHIDDMCSPAPALTPANYTGEAQEAKGKGKKEKKKNKMMKLDSRILGFSVTSAEDRLNVGARDYARDGP